MKNKNNIEVSVINYGGIITNILVPDKNGKREDITLGYDDMEGMVLITCLNIYNGIIFPSLNPAKFFQFNS